MRISAVVVSYDDPAAAATTARALVDQSLAPVDVLVVDNLGSPESAAELAGLGGTIHAIAPEENLGFAGGVAAAAEEARGDWLFLLNPDAVAEPRCLEHLANAAERSGAEIVGAQVLMADGVTTNAGDNPLHIAGLCWSGRCGDPAEDAPVRDVATVSGAAMLIDLRAWRRTGGFQRRFFLYHEDADLCWRVRLTGGRVVYCPDARVRHDYSFDKGTQKWFFLERNRLWGVLANYRAVTLVLLAPLLAGVEGFVLLRALREGWARQKLRAWADLLRSLGELRRWRRRVQGGRTVGDRAILSVMTGRFETTLVASGAVKVVNPLIAAYRRVLLRLPL